jgi:hypothetical protein
MSLANSGGKSRSDTMSPLDVWAAHLKEWVKPKVFRARLPDLSTNIIVGFEAVSLRKNGWARPLARAPSRCSAKESPAMQASLRGRRGDNRRPGELGAALAWLGFDRNSQGADRFGAR